MGSRLLFRNLRGWTSASLRQMSMDCRDPCDRKRFKKFPAIAQDDWTPAQKFRALFFLGLAAIGLQSLYLFTMGHHPERPEFIAYPHLRLRNRPYPWGDGNHTLFHNCKLNALPDGYEDECEC